jgi:hypothetical protein
METATATADQSEAARRRKQDEDDLWMLLLLAIDEDEPQTLWRRLVPSAFSGLLDLDGFTWEPGEQVYRSDTGTTVNGSAVQRLVLTASHATEIDIERSLTDAIKDGSPESLDVWHDAVVEQLVDLYAAAGAAGVGGIDNLTEDDLHTIADRVEAAQTNVADIIHEMRQTDPQVSVAQAVNRAGMNASGAHTVFQQTRRSSHAGIIGADGNATFTMEKNVLTQTAEHCTECPSLSREGWLPIGTMPAPGLRQCRGNCKCHMEYGTDYEAAHDD